MRPFRRRQLRTVVQLCFRSVFSLLWTISFSAALKIRQISEDKVPSVCQPLIRKHSREFTPETDSEVTHLTLYVLPLSLLTCFPFFF